MASVPLLFAKAKAAGVQVSPCGRWLGWLARSSSGVLDLFAAPLPLQQEAAVKGDNTIAGAFQLTDSADRDICFSFRSRTNNEELRRPSERS